jgi:hypothetical protein
LRNLLGNPVSHDTSHNGQEHRGCEELTASTPLKNHLTGLLVYRSQILGNVVPNPIE